MKTQFILILHNCNNEAGAVRFVTCIIRFPQPEIKQLVGLYQAYEAAHILKYIYLLQY